MIDQKKYAELILKIVNIEKLPSNVFFNFNGEKSKFYRLNKSLLRQVSTVDQCELYIIKKNENDEDYFSIQLSGDIKEDCSRIEEIAGGILNFSQNLGRENKREVISLPEMSNESFCQSLDRNLDVVGLITEGRIFRGVAIGGSSDLSWFETDRADVDYSIYEDELCVKEFHSSEKINQDSLANSIKENKSKLNLLRGQKVELEPGEYDAYFSPSAVNEMLSMFNWYGLQGKAFAEKQSVFMDLFERNKALSPKFSLRENFDLMLSPSFNSEAQESERIVDLIKDGELVQPLVSSLTARKYGYDSNNAELNETLRSSEVLEGEINERDLINELRPGLYISDLHYLNWSNRKNASITGMTRYGCYYINNRGEKAPIKDMRFNMSLYDVFGAWLRDLSKERKIFANSHTYDSRHLGGTMVPGILSKINFTL